MHQRVQKSDLKIFLVWKNIPYAIRLFNNQNIHSISTVMMQLLSMKTKKTDIKKATLESLNSEVEWQHISSRRDDDSSYRKVIKHILVSYVLTATNNNTSKTVLRQAPNNCVSFSTGRVRLKSATRDVMQYNRYTASSSRGHVSVRFSMSAQAKAIQDTLTLNSWKSHS